MIKILTGFLIIFFLYFTQVSAEIIEDVEIKNNNRISKQTIITYGQIELNKNYDLNSINQVIKNLYETNFFEALKIDIIGNKFNYLSITCLFSIFNRPFNIFFTVNSIRTSIYFIFAHFKYF